MNIYKKSLVEEICDIIILIKKKNSLKTNHFIPIRSQKYFFLTL